MQTILYTQCIKTLLPLLISYLLNLWLPASPPTAPGLWQKPGQEQTSENTFVICKICEKITFSNKILVSSCPDLQTCFFLLACHFLSTSPLNEHYKPNFNSRGSAGLDSSLIKGLRWAADSSRWEARACLGPLLLGNGGFRLVARAGFRLN